MSKYDNYESRYRDEMYQPRLPARQEPQSTWSIERLIADVSEWIVIGLLCLAALVLLAFGLIMLAIDPPAPMAIIILLLIYVALK